MYLIDIEEQFKYIINKTDFRVSIFGSARIKPDHEKKYAIMSAS